MRILSIIFFFCTFLILPDQAHSQLNIEAQIAHYQLKAERYLGKSPEIKSQYRIDERGIALLTIEPETKQPLIDFFLAWDEVEAMKHIFKTESAERCLEIYLSKGPHPLPVRNGSPAAVLTLKQALQVLSQGANLGLVEATPPAPQGRLAGLRIALDPGHFATSLEMALVEGKAVNISAEDHPKSSSDTKFWEAALTLKVALALRDKLEAEGAEVFLTRDETRSNALGIEFEEWMETRFADELARAKDQNTISAEKYRDYKNDEGKALRYFYGNFERVRRAEMINAWRPDVTVIIHFNVDSQNRPWNKTTKNNYNMAFVGGSFLPGELSKPEDRLGFLRLLITDDLEQSIVFSSLCLDQFTKQLQVPVATADKEFYLRDYCAPTDKTGVYCRNLLLTNRIHGPLVYGETLFQDHEDESRKLANPNGKRLGQVTEAYYQALLEWGALQKN